MAAVDQLVEGLLLVLAQGSVEAVEGRSDLLHHLEAHAEEALGPGQRVGRLQGVLGLVELVAGRAHPLYTGKPTVFDAWVDAI